MFYYLRLLVAGQGYSFYFFPEKAYKYLRPAIGAAGYSQPPKKFKPFSGPLF